MIGRRAHDYVQVQIRNTLIAQGVPPAEADRQAAMHVINSERAELPSLPRGPDGHVLLSPEEAGFDSDMAAAMGQIGYGNGADVDNLAGAATPIAMEREFGATSTPTPVAYRVPGPRDTTGYAEPGAPIYDEEAAAEYSPRSSMQDFSEEQIEAELASGGPYAGGGYMPSQKDRDMYARGMVPTYDSATGEVGYTVAYPQQPAFGDGVPTGAPGRLGSRADLRQPVIDARTGTAIPGTSKYDKTTQSGPLGDVEVYSPSPAFRAQIDAHETRQRVGRLADRAGYGPSERAALVASQAPVDLVSLRAQGDAVRAADKAARQEAVVRRRMAQTNPLEYMNRDDISDWNRMVAADAMLRRGYSGATPLDVEARRLEQAARWAAGAVTGALAGNQGGLMGEQWEARQRGMAVARAKELAEARGGKVTVAERARIARQVDAEFPGHGQAAADALDVQEPLPLPEGHGNPGRMPDGTYPMM